MTHSAITTLTLHPLLLELPRVDAETEAVRALIHAIRDVGRILEPLKINRGRVVAGRKRFLAAQTLGLAEVPTDPIADDEVATVILQTLLARAHYTKGARAYLAIPIVDSALKETRQRAISAARSGLSGSKSESTQWTFANSTDELIEKMQISRALYYQAKEIRKKFAGVRGLREEWEPKILSGEMGLGQVQQAIAGKIAALEGRTAPKGDAQQLLFDLFATAKVRFSRWETLDKAGRAAVIGQFRDDFLPSLPDELRAEFESFLTER